MPSSRRQGPCGWWFGHDASHGLQGTAPDGTPPPPAVQSTTPDLQRVHPKVNLPLAKVKPCRSGRGGAESTIQAADDLMFCFCLLNQIKHFFIVFFIWFLYFLDGSIAYEAVFRVVVFVCVPRTVKKKDSKKKAKKKTNNSNRYYMLALARSCKFLLLLTGILENVIKKVQCFVVILGQKWTHWASRAGEHEWRFHEMKWRS